MDVKTTEDRALAWRTATQKVRRRAGDIDKHEERRKLCAKAIASADNASTSAEQDNQQKKVLAGLTDFPDKHYGAADQFDLRTLVTTHHKLMLSNLYVDFIHDRSYYLCRVIAAPYLRNSALHTIVEDVAGAPIRLQLRNFVSPSLPDCTDASWALGLDDKLIVLDPICQRSEYDYQACITVCNPSHLILLDDDDEFLKTVIWISGPRAPEAVAEAKWAVDNAVSDLHRVGNGHFAEGRLCAAATAYRKAARLCTRDNKDKHVMLLSNASQALLQLGHYRLALRETGRALALQQNHAKTIYRQVRARIGLGMFEQALADIAHGLHVSPETAEFYTLRAEIASRAQASSVTGYDFHKLMKDAHKASHTMFMCPDYVGPVQVAHSAEKGRGLYAADNITAGSLVLAEKALAIVFDGDVGRLCGAGGEGGVGDKMLLHQSSLGRQLVEDELCWRLLQIATSNPVIGQLVEELSAGDTFAEYERLQQSKPGIDSLRVRWVMKCNSLGEAYASGKRFASWRAALKQNDDAAVAKVGGDFSWYCVCSSMGKGIWRGAAVLNHDCNPNCLFLVLGDFIFVSTFRDVRKGEELTIAYFDQTERYHVRQSLSKTFSFVCCCQLCCREIEFVNELDRVLVEKQENDDLQGDVDDETIDQGKMIASCSELVSKVRALMPRPSYLLSKAFEQLSRAYEKAGQRLEAAKKLGEAVMSLYDECDDSGQQLLTLHMAPYYALLTAHHFALFGDIERAQHWLSIGKSLALRRFWGSETMVELVYEPCFISHVETCLATLKKFRQTLDGIAAEG